MCRDIPIEDCQLVKEENCREGEVEEVEECSENEVEECEIVPHEECHQVTVELPSLQDKQVQQIVCDQENEIEDTTTTEKVAEQENNGNEENVLENNYDEILDAVNTIFGSGTTEDVNEVSVNDIATTEAEPLTTEEPLPTTTILPSVPTTITTTTTNAPTTTTTTVTTTEAATTTETTSTTSEAATSESSSTVSAIDIVTEAVTPSTLVPTEPKKTDDSKIHFRDDGPVRDFTKRIFVDDGLVDARRKAIEERRKAASDASRIFFPTEEEGGASIPS